MNAFPPDDRTRGTERPIGDEPRFDTAQSAAPKRRRTAGPATIAVLVLVVLAVVLLVLL